MTSDFADREAASIIDLCRSLAGAPGDLHGIVAAKLRIIHAEGRTEGAINAIVQIVRKPTANQGGIQ